MVFMCSMACAFALIALAAGVGLLIWGFRNDGVGVVLAKVFGFIITILASAMFLANMYGCVSKMSRGHYHMGGYHHMQKKCHYQGCTRNKCNKEFCLRDMKKMHMHKKLEQRVN